MKKILLTFILMLGLFLTACNGKITGEITVNIFNEEAKIKTVVVQTKEDEILFKSLEKAKELAFVYENDVIKSIRGIEAKEGFQWNVYLNNVLMTKDKIQLVKNKDVLDIKLEKIESITVNFLQKDKDTVVYNVPLNGEYLIKNVLTSFDELKFVISGENIISILDITLEQGKEWQLHKNSILLDIVTAVVSDGDVINISSTEYDQFVVVIKNITGEPFNKTINFTHSNDVISLLSNDIDINLQTNNGTIESIKGITLEKNYLWKIYLNDVIVDSINNITVEKDDVITFIAEEIITISVEVFNGDSMIYEDEIDTKGVLNLLAILKNSSNLEFNYEDGAIVYVRSIFPKKNYKWEVLSDDIVIEDLENHQINGNEEISIRLVYVPIVVDFDVVFADIEFRTGNVINFQINIISGPSLGAKVTSSNPDVLTVNGLSLQANIKGQAIITIQIGDSEKVFEFFVKFKRYVDMSDEEFLALTPEEQDEVWEEHLEYEAEIRHLEVERIKAHAISLPSVATDDLDLILGTTVKGVWITWESNYPGIISPLGKVSKSTSDTTVTLKLTVWSSEESVTVNREIFVEGFVMEPLPANNLTFAYLPAYGWQGIREADIAKLDVINFQAGTIGANSKLVIGTQNIFFELLKLREKGVKIVICVYGGSWFGGNTDFEDMAIDPVTRAIFVQSVVEQIQFYDFDGIDLDWEIPSVVNARYFTALVRDLREAFDAINPNLIISAAVPNSNYPSNFEFGKIGAYMSHLHLMNYDMGWNNITSHNSVLYSGGNNTYADISVDKTVRTFSDLGFPKEKMVIGSAFYGKIFKNVVTAGNGLKVTVSGAENLGTTINYHNVYNDYLKVNPQYIRRDPIGHADYYYDNVKGIFISYESVNVMKEKTQYVIDNGLAGIMFWDYNHDQTGQLLQAIYQTYPVR